jgi:hypothetical protein
MVSTPDRIFGKWARALQPAIPLVLVILPLRMI